MVLPTLKQQLLDYWESTAYSIFVRTIFSCDIISSRKECLKMTMFDKMLRRKKLMTAPLCGHFETGLGILQTKLVTRETSEDELCQAQSIINQWKNIL